MPLNAQEEAAPAAASAMELIGPVIPVVVLFGIGFLFRRIAFLKTQTVGELRKLVVRVALPALLFQAFLTVEADARTILMAAGIFVLTGLLMFAAFGVNRLSGNRLGVRPFLFGGYEAGMLGYALFLSAFGQAALSTFASVDLGQVLFVFLVLMPMLESRRGGGGLKTALKGIAGSPVIWAIVLGLVIGLVLRRADSGPQVLGPVMDLVELVGGLTVPLISLVIGYELEVHPASLGKALVFVLVRKAVLVGVGVVVLATSVISEPLTQAAFLTLMILPPPFVVILAAKEGEAREISTILSVSTIVSVLAFIILLLTGIGS